MSIMLHFAGPQLDPDVITQVLNFYPTRGYKLGDSYKSADGRIFHRKNGIWAFNQTTDTADLDRALEGFGGEISPLLLHIKEENILLKDLPGIERAHLDIFVVATIPPGASTARHFRLSPDSAKLLAAVDLPIDLTVDNIVESGSELSEASTSIDR